jgi:hypothetical protein
MSLFDLSLDAANRYYAWGWRLSMFGALVTFLGVLMLTWGMRVRDQDFEEQVAVLHSRAATSEERAAVLEKDAAQLRLDLEGIKLPGVRAEQRDDRRQYATRHVTDEQRTCLLGRLRDFKSSVTVRFEPDQEAGEYAASLREAFSKAGVTVSFAGAARSGMSGVHIASAEGEALPAASELTSIMQYCGIALDSPIESQQFPHAPGDARSAPNGHPEDVQIFVGTKSPAK